MLHILIKTPIKLLFLNNKPDLIPLLVHLRFLHKSSISKNPGEEKLELQKDPSSLTVSYLINSCGLSPQSALATAKKIQIKATEKPDSNLNSLKSYGFDDTQITNLIRKCPELLLSKWDKTIKPKLEFLRAFGYSNTDLTKLVSSVPHIITAGLENKLRPNFELLSSIIGDNQRIASAVRQTSRLIRGNPETKFLPNVRTLQTCGVPDAAIAKLAARHLRVLMMSTDKFKVNVELVRKMGFNPSSSKFVYMVAILSQFSPSIRDRKMELFKSLGWSEKEVYSAFPKSPCLMAISEQKIRMAMDFFVKKLQWTPSVLVANPVVLSLSLEKRVMPRCSVMRMLESKGLETRGSGVSFLIINNRDFLSKYVTKYEKEFPTILEAYKTSLELVDHKRGTSKNPAQSALATAKKIQLKATEKPDYILNSLKSYGFDDTQIASLIRKCPILFSSNWDKTFKPKLDYLRAFGYSETELTELVSSVPHMITASLQKRLKPNFELLSSIIGDKQRIASAIRQTSRLIQGNLETDFLPNVETLRTCSVPDAGIARLAARHPRVVLMSTEKFKVKVELVREMGFNPSSSMFVHGVAALSRIKPSTWDKKMELYKSLGWLEKEVYSAFSKHPFIMVLSDQKIRKAMDFFVKKQRWTPSVLAANPVVMSLSLEKRVMPRCSVMRVLESKGLETRGSGVSFLMISEKNFLNKYVTKYDRKFPAILEAYKSSLESVGPERGTSSVSGS